MNPILPKKQLSLSFDNDFYRQLDQNNFYKNRNKNSKNNLEYQLSVIKKNSQMSKIITSLKNFYGVIAQKICSLGILLTKISPFKDILEITSFLTKSRDI